MIYTSNDLDSPKDVPFDGFNDKNIAQSTNKSRGGRWNRKYWKTQVRKMQVWNRTFCRDGKCKYWKRKYEFARVENASTENVPVSIPVNTNVEITMELPLIFEWVSLCLGFYLLGGPKMAPFLYALTLPNINRFLKLFHCRNHEKICNNTVTKDLTKPHVCLYTTLWNVSLLKATIENKTTSVTTYFKKLTTGNVFIVSVIV